MAQNQVKETDIAVLLAAIQNSVGPIQVDAEKVAKQLGMSLSSIPPKFTAIRKRYASLPFSPKTFSVFDSLIVTVPSTGVQANRDPQNIDIKVVNSGALQRNRQHSPKKRLSNSAPKAARLINSLQREEQSAILPEQLCFRPEVVQAQRPS